jgi:hypothetical protein
MNRNPDIVYLLEKGSEKAFHETMMTTTDEKPERPEKGRAEPEKEI